MNKNIITIATDKSLYVKYACNLAQSFLLWHKQADIRFFIVTDLPELIPLTIRSQINIIKIKKGSLGNGFSPKLYLDKVAPIGQTLFIDSDCLIFGNLNNVFEKFRGNSVSVIGNYIAEGDWFGDIEAICKQFNIKHLPKFNGGIYYLENGNIASKTYQLARNIEKDYDKLGFVRLRNKPNDEVIMALAMQLEGLKPIIDDGTIMSDPFACPGNYKLDIKTGKTLMINPPEPSPVHRYWYKFHKVSPLIVHFLGSHTTDYQYKSETAKLPLLLNNQFNLYQNLKIILTIELTAKIKIQFKNLFRPLYRVLLGKRKIQISARV